jgi:predicted anti-sigma-YlaC factor YlaD
MEHAVRLPQPQRRDVIMAAVCWAVEVVALLALGLAASLDAMIAGNVPRVGTLPWWATILALTNQAITLLWVRAAPRAALLLVAAIPLVFTVSLLLLGRAASPAPST